MSSSRSEFLAGVKAELPLLLGVIPFGMIYGVLALKAGLPAGFSQAMSAVIFAGSAQFITTQLVANGAPLIAIVITGIIINLRHALYSASISPYLKRLSPKWKWLLAYLLTDEAYAVSISYYTRSASLPPSEEVNSSDHRHWFFLGAGLALWSTWQLSTAAGIFLGAQIPDRWSLDYTLALTFIALVVPALKDRAGVAAAVTAGIASVVAFDLPLKLGLVVASFLGILVGLWSERK